MGTIHTKVIILFFISCFILILVYKDARIIEFYNVRPIYKNFDAGRINDHEVYLINTPKCKLRNLDPFNEEVISLVKKRDYEVCSKLPLLSYVRKSYNFATLHVNKTVLPFYGDSVKCYYRTVTRTNGSDFYVDQSSFIPFENMVVIKHEVVTVLCTNKTEDTVYFNTHSIVFPKSSTKTHKNSFKVLLISIDSMSRLNLIRTMPKTYSFLTHQKWNQLQGYNKIDDNTFPNLMAILTGFNKSYIEETCSWKIPGKLDECPFVWKKYKKSGYLTGYCEDQPDLGTFTYDRTGFTDPPTDYYFLPYFLEAEFLPIVFKDLLYYCMGPETSAERIMNVIKDFTSTLEKYPYFGLFWMNSFSHNELNGASMMDKKVEEMLQGLMTEDTIVFFFSDHGLRFGDIRRTQTGWYEERLPFFFAHFPERFKEENKLAYQNFKGNEFALTSPYDFYMTLQDILKFQGNIEATEESLGCPSCRSLFTKINEDRSCEEAGILEHWCTCLGFKEAQFEEKKAQEIETFVLQSINGYIEHNKDCVPYNKTTIQIYESEPLDYKNEQYILVRLETKPNALFETTLQVQGDTYTLSGIISRLSAYYWTSLCVQGTEMKMYCYCANATEIF